jgi:hypothetical protein
MGRGVTVMLMVVVVGRPNFDGKVSRAGQADDNRHLMSKFSLDLSQAVNVISIATSSALVLATSYLHLQTP